MVSFRKTIDDEVGHRWGVATFCLQIKRSKFNSLFPSLYGFMIIDYLECQCGCRGLSYVGPICLFNDTFKMSVNAGLLVLVLTFLVFVTSCTLSYESFTFNASYWFDLIKRMGHFLILLFIIQTQSNKYKAMTVNERIAFLNVNI